MFDITLLIIWVLYPGILQYSDDYGYSLKPRINWQWYILKVFLSLIWDSRSDRLIKQIVIVKELNDLDLIANDCNIFVMEAFGYETELLQACFWSKGS